VPPVGSAPVNPAPVATLTGLGALASPPLSPPISG
jgi:hypothetical protein